MLFIKHIIYARACARARDTIYNRTKEQVKHNILCEFWLIITNKNLFKSFLKNLLKNA